MEIRGSKLTLMCSALAGAMGGAMMTLLLVGAPVVAQEAAKSGQKLITAEEFQLVDKEGRSRAVLAFSAEGEPYLGLFDADHNQRVWLGLSANPGLAIKDHKETKTRALLSLDDATGQPSLVMRNRQHQVSAIEPKQQ